MTRHSREDALTEREFVLLLEGARDLPSPQAFQTRFCIYGTARLGLRAGELAHFSTEWIDHRERLVEVPSHDPCRKGKRPGEVCGYCRARAKDHVENTNLTVDDARELLEEEYDDLADEALEKMAEKKVEDTNITLEEALSERWEPKTEAGARAIPFDHDVRLQLCIERFAERYDQWPRSRATVNRRINAAAENADLEARVYPHALRATAASAFAYKEISPYALMSIMGWSDLATARTYIQASDENAAREVRAKHR